MSIDHDDGGLVRPKTAADLAKDATISHGAALAFAAAGDMEAAQSSAREFLARLGKCDAAANRENTVEAYRAFGRVNRLRPAINALLPVDAGWLPVGQRGAPDERA